MDRGAFADLWEGKKGSPLTEEEKEMVETMKLRELAKIFEMVRMEMDWEAEIKKMKAKKAVEAEKKQAEKKKIEEEERRKVNELTKAYEEKERQAVLDKEKEDADNKAIAEGTAKPKAAKAAEEEEEEAPPMVDEEEDAPPPEDEEEIELTAEELQELEDQMEQEDEAPPEEDDEPPPEEDEEEFEIDDEELERLMEAEQDRMAKKEEEKLAEQQAAADAEEAELEAKREELGGNDEEDEDMEFTEEELAAMEAELEGEEGGEEEDLLAFANDEADAVAAAEAEAEALALAQAEADAEAAAEAEAQAEAEALALAEEAQAEAEAAEEALREIEAEAAAQAEKAQKAKEEAEAAARAAEEAALLEQQAKDEAEAKAAQEASEQAKRVLEEAERVAAEEAAQLKAEEEAQAKAQAEAEESVKKKVVAAAAVQEASVSGSAAEKKAPQAAASKKKRRFKDENGKWILPPTYVELDVDPRTELDIVDLPDAIKECTKESFGEHPIAHWAGETSKMNHLRKWDKRLTMISNYAIFLAHPQTGFMARALEITDVESLIIGEDEIGFRVPKEFDLVLKAPGQVDKMVEIIQSVYRQKKKKDLPVVKGGEAKMAEEFQLKKPGYWHPEQKHVHSKEELFNRLVAMNREDETLAYLNLKKDPRTQLPLMEIPREHRPQFQSGPFKTDPLLHFFCECKKINSRLGSDKRFCIITNACIYLTYTNGNLQRCIIAHKATEMLVGPTSIALKIPEEFDVYIKFADAGKAKEAQHIVQTIYKFKMQKDIPTAELTPEAAASQGKMCLNKPSGWKPRFAPVLQRKDLIDYLRKLGIRPDME